MISSSRDLPPEDTELEELERFSPDAERDEEEEELLDEDEEENDLSRGVLSLRFLA